MQSLNKTLTARAVFSVAFFGVAASLSSQVAVSAAPIVSVPKLPTVAATVAAGKAAAERVIAPVAKPAIRFASVSEAALRARIKFQTVRWGGKPVQTLDEASRILLAQAAAEKAGLHDVGLSFHDVYGVIEAETSWIQRTGASKDGTPNLGLAQFEPRTAKGMGLADPEDPVQAVFAAARYMKDGAKWAGAKLAPLKLSPEQHAAKLREGISVHYNLSIKGRNKWDGLNTAQLPVETQRHIRNASVGAVEAAQLARQLKA
jgi:hypothetical protein